MNVELELTRLKAAFREQAKAVHVHFSKSLPPKRFSGETLRHYTTRRAAYNNTPTPAASNGLSSPDALELAQRRAEERRQMQSRIEALEANERAAKSGSDRSFRSRTRF